MSYFQLPAPRRRLLTQAYLLLALVDGALRLARVRRVQGWLRRFAGAASRPPDPAYPDQVAWALRRASRRLFGERDSCLPQALAGSLLLRRAGHTVRVKIGVRKDEAGAMRAHAWVELDTPERQVVIGDSAEGLERYTPLPDLDGAGD